jgi:transcriptional activator SPT7
LLDEKDDLSQLWWGAVQSDSLLNNGLPGIPFGPSSSSSSSFPNTSSSSKLQQHSSSSVKHKRRKPPRQQQQQRQPANPKSLLSMMNHNIVTMRRVRHTHAKFAALTASSAPPEDEEQGAEGGGGMYGTGGGSAIRAGLPSGIGSSSGLVGNSFGLSEDEGLDDKIDEEPWTAGRGKKGKVKNISGVEIGEANATDCLHWAGNKILEHVGFQGMLFGF